MTHLFRRFSILPFYSPSLSAPHPLSSPHLYSPLFLFYLLFSLSLSLCPSLFDTFGPSECSILPSIQQGRSILQWCDGRFLHFDRGSAARTVGRDFQRDSALHICRTTRAKTWNSGSHCKGLQHKTQECSKTLEQILKKEKNQPSTLTSTSQHFHYANNEYRQRISTSNADQYGRRDSCHMGYLEGFGLKISRSVFLCWF